jgi:ubiquinone biosynthesis protein COQ4
MEMMSSLRIRPREAAGALTALFRDPDDTAQVFVLIEALSGDNRLRGARKLRQKPGGAALLHKSLAEVLQDRERLQALPADSLGRAYLALCDRAGISPGGLVSVSAVEEPRELDPDERRMHNLLRDSHDLWHVVTGYDTDTVGEAAILAFTFAQTRNPALLVIVLMAMVKISKERAWVRSLLFGAFMRGLRSTWFPGEDWEALLARPLDEVRRSLRVGPAPVYTPVWPDEYRRELALR